MRQLVGVVLPVGLLFSASGAVAHERCLATYYKLPPSIAKDIRPYLLCGLISDRSDTGETLNGVSVLMHGQGLASCGEVRARSFVAADQRLASIRMKPVDRKAYLDDQFAKADQFLQTATKLNDFGVGEEPKGPPCRTQNAQH